MPKWALVTAQRLYFPLLHFDVVVVIVIALLVILDSHRRFRNLLRLYRMGRGMLYPYHGRMKRWDSKLHYLHWRVMRRSYPLNLKRDRETVRGPFCSSRLYIIGGYMAPGCKIHMHKSKANHHPSDPVALAVRYQLVC